MTKILFVNNPPFAIVVLSHLFAFFFLEKSLPGLLSNEKKKHNTHKIMENTQEKQKSLFENRTQI
jgi:hypothetical protein